MNSKKTNISFRKHNPSNKDSISVSKNGKIITIVVFAILSVSYFALIVWLSSSKMGSSKSPATMAMLMSGYILYTILPFAMILRIVQYIIELICIRHTTNDKQRKIK